jgi:hypothetical protein
MRRFTAVLAVTVAAVAAVPTAASAGMPSYAGEKPSTYGKCVAYEAMAGLDPVSDFTGRSRRSRFSAATARRSWGRPPVPMTPRCPA